ncbi:MAG: hypothetical protein ISS23_00850 [Nanoarchaeota archaeon]|nr:hypothetical protein [Nanoarchaeota archaeon]
MVFKRNSESYLAWEEYSELIAQRDHLRFISETARKSIDNYWRKMEVLSKWI